MNQSNRRTKDEYSRKFPFVLASVNFLVVLVAPLVVAVVLPVMVLALVEPVVPVAVEFVMVQVELLLGPVVGDWEAFKQNK